MNQQNKAVTDNDDVVESASCDDKGDSISKESIESAGNTSSAVKASQSQPLEKEINGPKGLEPTRYGDWESKGRCYDF